MAPASTYIYTALPAQSIRILELLPGDPANTAPLECRIVIQHVAADHHQPYEALSYVWGDPTPTDRIRCYDGATGGGSVDGFLGIGANLAKALTAFRLTGSPRRIWVDALSINQNDVIERQAQVRLMGDVFRNAQMVLAWLGTFKDPDSGELTARLAIDYLRVFNKNPQEELQNAQQHLHINGKAEYDKASPSYRSWLAVKELFDLDYFHRAWIIQEVGLGRQARLFWGHKNVWLDWSEVADFARFMDDNGAALVNYFQLKSWVCNHINLVWEMNSDGKPRFNFVEVLHWARVHQSTDPRDYIYALLSHPSATVDGTLLVQPDYRISTTQAYTDLALNVIERTKSLHILSFVDHGEELDSTNLPTWVPDWHAPNLVAPLRSPTNAAAETDHNIVVKQFNDSIMLECNGFSIDTVQAMSGMFDPSELTVTTIERELRKQMPFLIDHIFIKISVNPEIPLNSPILLIAALSFLLPGGFWNGEKAVEVDIIRQTQNGLSAYILEFEKIKPNDYTPGFFSSLSEKEQALIREMASQGSASQYIQDITWTCMCRKVFRTANGHIGLGPRIMREGDLCVVLEGAIYPMILRKRGDNFHLVGPALLYGFMDGEARRLCSQGKLHKQSFHII